VARLRTEHSRIQFLQDEIFSVLHKNVRSELVLPSLLFSKDGSLVVGKGAISSIVKVKNEWSSTSTPPISLYDRKWDVLQKINKKSKCVKSVAWDMYLYTNTVSDILLQFNSVLNKILSCLFFRFQSQNLASWFYESHQEMPQYWSAVCFLSQMVLSYCHWNIAWDSSKS
jgi:hypothetical protein